MSVDIQTILENAEFIPCKRCGQDITWNQKARDYHETNRPIDEDGEIHDCPAYEKKSSGFQQKKSFQKEKPKFKPVQKDQQVIHKMEDANEAFTEILNTDKDTAVKLAMVSMLETHKKTMDSIDNEMQRLYEKVDKMETVVEQFIRYNPFQYFAKDIISMVMDKKGIEPKPVTAAQLKEKTHSTEDHNPTNPDYL